MSQRESKPSSESKPSLIKHSARSASRASMRQGGTTTISAVFSDSESDVSDEGAAGQKGLAG